MRSITFTQFQQEAHAIAIAAERGPQSYWVEVSYRLISNDECPASERYRITHARGHAIYWFDGLTPNEALTNYANWALHCMNTRIFQVSQALLDSIHSALEVSQCQT